MKHRTLIEQLGGPGKVADLLGTAPNTPCKWGDRGIPAAHWPAMASAARKIGIPITADDLARTAPQFPARRSRIRQPRARRSEAVA